MLQGHSEHRCSQGQGRLEGWGPHGAERIFTKGHRTSDKTQAEDVLNKSAHTEKYDKYLEANRS